jgi:replicative superfamily II helicase
LKNNDEQDLSIDITRYGRNLVVVFPTGKGKTIVAQDMAQSIVDKNKKFIIASPLKALAQEQVDTFGRNFNVLVLTGDYQGNKKKDWRKYDGFTMTYEMLYMYIINRHPMLKQIGGIVFDEAHLMADQNRGHRVESSILILTDIKKYVGNPQILLLSATVRNPIELAENFKFELMYAGNDKRPIPLITNVVPYPYMEKLSAKQRNERCMQLFEAEILRKHTHPNGKVDPILYFLNSKGRCFSLKNMLSKKYPHLIINVHNADLEKEERVQIENDFRDNKIDILLCTTTLSMGLNMPCVACGMYGLTFWNDLESKEKLISFVQIIQIIGRAGRRGFSDNGYAYVLSDDRSLEGADVPLNVLIEKNISSPERLQSVIIPHQKPDYINGGFIQSPSNLESTLLGWINVGYKTYDELKRMFSRIFVDNVEEHYDYFDEIMEWLEINKFMKEYDGVYELANLGQVVVRQGINPKTALHLMNLKDVIETHPNIPMKYLWILLHATREFTGGLGVTQRSDDQIAVGSASRVLRMREIEQIISENDYFLDMIEENCDPENNKLFKAFGLVFHRNLKDMFPYIDRIKYFGSVGMLMKQSSWIVGSARKLFKGRQSKTVMDTIENLVKFTTNKFGVLIEGRYKEITYPIIQDEICEIVNSINRMSIKKANTLIKLGVTMDNIKTIDEEKMKEVEKKSRKMYSETKNTSRRYMTITKKWLMKFQEK